ncbi:2-hydroxyacid dehydrogenase [Psychroserpens sp.]|uniref:2-hydroxyacid dehydrogenase n=1 Tax=Psychroserpens sp. TaxID=2020870 RepID=UPI001B0705B2|nr:2-hydroxyacid dehydrogenase [Psychroserpens sp.]MBO6607475.1 2-hydroxyacid dehydrogenase [Psychroserpens sp.]MBO6654447.1 2-hydroxyacid dehydrogenase [Psychroserpens sp.]MBO6681204.1 2-hydroxyacid dehydrogenase [Psychroserpens sp.]MBO6749839.1 2-hydroxyacid dehydrogenase [Psychroserpens sp.]MBO6916173.1 2-hydroxyacid dehydrogenase [Psychroserpens sp.]
MKVLVYSAKAFEIPYLEKANLNKHQLTFIEDALSSETAMQAIGYDAISLFSADDANFLNLELLKEFGVKYITLRSVGFDNVNLKAAERLGIRVANVPAYSPYAIAEHGVSLLLALNRHLIDSNRRFKHYNFNLDNLVGIDLNQKKVGIIGTGNIGSVMVKIMHGFGCKLLGFDISEDQKLVETYGLRYTNLKTLCEQSDIISLNVPLNSETHYLINEDLLFLMKKDVIIINTARGAVVNTEHLLEALKSKRIGAYGADVFENERGIFFKDRSNEIPDDDLLMQLNAYPNVLITGHHAFLTEEALTNIAETTIWNLDQWMKGLETENELTVF